MSVPRRLIDDPDADRELSRLLRESGGARPLDDVTRRRLRTRLARASAVPAVAAGWLFVKSAAAALGAVAVTGVVVSVTGILPWPSPTEAAPTSSSAPSAPRRSPAELPPEPEAALEVPAQPEPEPEPTATSAALAPSLAPPSASSAGSLSAESALLEEARREMRLAPSGALQIAAEHARRFPRGQLAAERTLIQIEALHRLGRDAEARRLASTLSSGAARGLYDERVRRLLGDRAP
jgi:hypothetical protein